MKTNINPVDNAGRHPLSQQGAKMEDLKEAEIKANIAKLTAEADKLKAETESIKINVALNIIKVGLSGMALTIALIVGIDKLMGP